MGKEINSIKSKFEIGYSAFKDFMVKDNFGLHLMTFYIIYELLFDKIPIVGFIISVVCIILVEVVDKHLLKGIFSKKDILAGIIGLSLVLIKGYILSLWG